MQSGPNDQGMNQPYTPEQMQQWQQSGMPPQMTPDMMQQMWAQQQQWQQQPYTVPLNQMTPEQIQQMQYDAYVWQMQQAQAGQQPMAGQRAPYFDPAVQSQQMPPYYDPAMMQPGQQMPYFDPNMQQMPPFQPQQTVQPGKRGKKPKKPKMPGQKSNGRKLVLALLIVAVLGGGAFYFVQNMMSRQQSTAVIEMATMGTSYTGDALIVRNEAAFDDEGVQSIEYVAQEGSVVYRGDVLCYVYSTGYSTSEISTLQDYRDQINTYQQTLLASETAYDQRMERLENEVLERGLEVRSLVHGARGNLLNQEKILDTAITQRQNYFRTKYASDTRLARLYDNENTQEQRIESWIKQKVATQESIVSFYTDGFEYALSPTQYENYTPSQVRDMINGKKPETSTAARGRTDLYRLVRKDNYAVLMLIRDNTWNPTEGDTYKLVLEQFSSTVVDAQVRSFTRSGGELLVRLAVLGDVNDVLYMRTCQAQLGEYVDCMVVPSAALYTQNDSQGVVIVTDSQQLFVPVNVLREEGGKAYIAAIQTGVLSEGMTVRLFH